MSDKHFVGHDLTEFEDNGFTRPVSRVTLLIDDDNQITAGDDTGYELTADCPHGTQAMADAILAKMKGYKYRMFTADSVRYDPAAELGDGITVSGVYGVLSQLSDDGSGFPDVTAPGEADLEDEYPTGGGPLTKQMERKFAYTRSIISKTSEEIKLLVENTRDSLQSSITQTDKDIRALVEDTKNNLSAEFNLSLDGISTRVDGLDGQYSALSQTVDGFTFSGPDGKTYVYGANIETGGITADQIKSGSITADKLNITGAITFEDLAQDAQGQITMAQSMASTAFSLADDANSAATAAQSEIDGWKYGGTTYIDGEKIWTGTVRASILEGGQISLINGSGSKAGYIDLSAASSGDYAIELVSNAALRLTAEDGDIYLGPNNYVGIDISSDDIGINSVDLIPSTSGGQALGLSYRPWGDIYLANDPTVGSDENLKHDIEDLPEKYVRLFDNLKPVRFKYNNGTSDRYHVGFIAQSVEKAMENCGIESGEFGGYVAGKDEYGGEIKMLRYGEFIGILWAKALEIDNRLKVLEGAI